MKGSPYEPEAIDVATKDGMPAAIIIGRRRLKVQRVLNVWRVDEDWWRCPVSRMYLFLEMENGARLTIFQDMIGNAWYKQNYCV
jgi:hypothetical protein